MEKDCTILISSCDTYIDILPAFFTLLKKYWPNLKYEIALSTESTNFEYPGLKIKNIHPDDPNITWTERIYDALSKIKSKQIFLLCDDFFLYNKVDNNKIKQIISWLQSNPQIATFTLWPSIEQNFKESSKFKGFTLRPKKAKYKIAVIAGLWNKKWLKKYLRGLKENAWQFEPNANQRSYKMLRPGKFYALTESQDSVFPYNFNKIGLFSGQWLPETESVFRQNKIEMNFTKRGFINYKYRIYKKSLQEAFILNSNIFPSHYNHKPRIYSPKVNILDNNTIRQEYKIKYGVNCIRWNISDIPGYTLSNIHILIVYKDNTKKTLDYSCIFGSFLQHEKSFTFNGFSPFIVAPTEPEKPFKQIIIDAKIKLPATKKNLDEAYDHFTSYANSSSESIVYKNECEYNNFLKS